MKKMFLLFVFLLSVSAVFAQPSADNMDNDTKKLYNEGIKFSKEGKYKQAVQKFDEALKKTNNYLLYMRKGTALQKEVKNASSADREKILKEAIASYERCFDTYPNYDLAYFKIGACYFSLKDYENAVKYFEKTKEVTKNKKYVKAADKNIMKAKEKIGYPYLLKGNEEQSKRNYSQAVKNYQKVLEYYNSDAAYLGLADVYSETGEFEKSLEAAKNALMYRKTIPEGSPYYFMGAAFHKMGKDDLAVENFKKCLKDKSSKNKGYRDRAAFDLKAIKK